MCAARRVAQASPEAGPQGLPKVFIERQAPLPRSVSMRRREPHWGRRAECLVDKEKQWK
jgi:hypothetical protein